MMEGKTPALRIHLFGAMQVETEDGPTAGRCAKKELWLLAFLALRAGKAVTREYLAGLLWPDNTEENALYNMRRCLSNLRSALGAQSDRLQVVKPRSLRLDLTEAYLDVDEFDRLMARGAFAEVVALYRAPLLEDCLEEWAGQERITRELAYLKALGSLADGALDRQEWAEAIHYTRLQIAADPLQEQAYRTLMQAQAAAGNHAAAVQTYRDLRVRLHEEIHSTPDPTTVALYEAIRQEARKQVGTPATARSFSVPVPSPPDSLRLSLPQPITRLIGRREEMQEILQHLRGARLVTLTGTGGIGKTRLSIEVARQSAERYADGAAFVELASLTNPELVARTLAHTLGISEEANVPLFTTLSEALQKRELLLVLDNCEHLLDVCAALTNTLLTACPRLRILATSRQALGLPGEVVWRLPSLPVPPDCLTISGRGRVKADTSEALEYDSVQLFLERVHQVSPEWRLSPASLPILVDICRQLDGIPLALELAAGRVRTLSLEHIAARLHDRFSLLTGGNRAALPRQQTLRAVVDWSYVLLSEAEKALLRRLAVFVGGWGLEAAEAICCDREGRETPLILEKWEVLDVLSALVDKSLVAVEHGSEGMRYRLLETMREYASERLIESGESEDLHNRHRDWYVAFTDEAFRYWNGPDGEMWLDRCERESDNLRAALVWSAGRPDSAEAHLRMAGNLWMYWAMRGDWQEGLAHLQSALAREGTEKWTALRASAMSGAGALAANLSDFALAWRMHQEAMGLQQSLGNRAGVAASFHNMGNVAIARGHFSEAWDCYSQAHDIQTTLGNRWAAAYAHIGLGNVCSCESRFEEARVYFEKSLATFRALNISAGVLLALGNIGNVVLHAGHPAEAAKYYEEALALCREPEYPEGEFLYSMGLAEALWKLEDKERAKYYWRQCLRLAQRLDSKLFLLNAFDSMIKLLSDRGEKDKAVRLYGCTTAWRRRLGTQQPPHIQRRLEEHWTSLCADIGEATFAARWSEGEAMSLEAAFGEMIKASG